MMWHNYEAYDGIAARCANVEVGIVKSHIHLGEEQNMCLKERQLATVGE